MSFLYIVLYCTWWLVFQRVSERVLWNSRSQTLLDVVQSSRTEFSVNILAVFTDVTWHTVRLRDVMRTMSSHVNTQINSTSHRTHCSLEMRLYWELPWVQWDSHGNGNENGLVRMKGTENSTFSHLSPTGSWSSDTVNGPLFLNSKLL